MFYSTMGTLEGVPVKTKINRRKRKNLSRTCSLLKWIKHVSARLVNLTCQAINKTAATICFANWPNHDGAQKAAFFLGTL